MSQQLSIRIDPDRPKHAVSPYLYGHFAEHLGRCIYNGIWVGEDSPIENEGGIRLDTARALKKLKLPVLRWPGGCFADNYHWMDGIGPRRNRPRRHNMHWVQPETNHFGTDEFIRFCRMIETEPYICLNVGSGAVEEARAWVEYCNAAQDTAITRLRKEYGHPEPHGVIFWGIGNENWGCGGHMQPEYYADLYARFGTYVKPTAGDRAKLIACGSHPFIPDWDERFLDRLSYGRHLVDYIALHNYANLGADVTDLEFSADDYRTLVVDHVASLDSHIAHAAAVANNFSTPHHRIGVILDEWGTWFKNAVVQNGLYQQNTLQDALFAAASFHCFHRHGEHLYMTNMAQTVNVLQALVLTKNAQMITTPTYHVYEMFMPHRDGRYLETAVGGAHALTSPSGKTTPALSVSATAAESGKELFVSVVNLDLTQDMTATLDLEGGQGWTLDAIRLLAADAIHSHNTFEAPQTVRPADIEVSKAPDAYTFPARSIATLRFTRP